MSSDISHARLLQLLSYDPETGIFTWRVRTSNRIKVGARAGSRHVGGYTEIGVDGFRYLAHRLAWFYVHKEWPVDEIDHRNGVRTDNRISNIRPATQAENNQNHRGPSSKNMYSGIIGAHKCRDRWAARISVNGYPRHIGVYATAEEAHVAYVEAKQQLHPFSTLTLKVDEAGKLVRDDIETI